MVGHLTLTFTLWTGDNFQEFEIGYRVYLDEAMAITFLIVPAYMFKLGRQSLILKTRTEHVEKHSEVTGNPPKVILIGHSVGAYVLLEIISRHQHTMRRKAMKGIKQQDPDLIGGILLFPTIADIAKSPLGRVAKYVLRLPGFALMVGALAKALASILPERALLELVRMVTKFPDYAATATAAFVKSPIGVRQALHLAQDEMQTITRPKWQDEVWGAATSPGTNERDTINSNIYAYWGEDVSILCVESGAPQLM